MTGKNPLQANPTWIGAAFEAKGSHGTVRATNTCVSRSMNDLLRIAQLQPQQVNEALERLRRLGQEMRLRPGHPYLVRLRRATGLNFVSASRKHRHLLFVIEERRTAPCWTYREITRNNCEFDISSLTSDTLMNAIAGEPLSRLAVPHSSISSLIMSSLHDKQGWTVATLAPEWVPFCAKS